MRKLSCILCVVILLVLGSNAFAKVKMLDIVYLTDENIVTGEIVEIIPNETIKIKTTDGKLRTHPFDQIEKIDQVEVKLKSRTVATALASAFPIFPVGLLFPTGIPVLSGWGQFYNGQHLKGLGFLANGFISGNVFMASGPSRLDSNTMAGIGVGMILGGYALSIIDANLSAKKINTMKLKRYQPKDVSTSLNYIPNQGLMASYNVRF